MKKKIFGAKGIVVIVLVVVAVVLGIVYWPKESKAPEVPATSATSTPISTPTPSSTALGANVSSSGSGGLTITTTLGWNTYDNVDYGLTFQYPHDWTINALQPVGVLDNFNGKYDASGNIPAGGVEIDVVKTTLYGPLDDVIDTEIPVNERTAMAAVTVVGVNCREIFYGASLSGGSLTKNIGLYCLKGTTLVKIYMVYHAGDTNGGTYISDLNQILQSVKLSK